MKIRNTLVPLAVLAAAAAHAERIYGVNANFGLVSFDSATPGSQTSVGSLLSGLVAGQTLRGIDFRPATGELWAVSTNGSSGGQLYTVNLSTAALTAVGSGFALNSSSTNVSIDFNPTVDRIRLVDSLGNNLRLNPLTGGIAATDANLLYDPTDATSPSAVPAMSGVAYTNNFAGATTTTLYSFDSRNASLDTIGTLNSVQSPNTGITHTVGLTGLATGTLAGFDISGATGTAYLSANAVGGGTNLYSVNLGTGGVTSLGSLGTGFLDISVAPVPEPGTWAALGLGALAMLRRRRK